MLRSAIFCSIILINRADLLNVKGEIIVTKLKRQINQFGLGVSLQSQPLQTSFDQSVDPNEIEQFDPLGRRFQDEEARFFASQESTTLNPLSFFTGRTTPTPVQQQQVDEQRRFQEEIANRGLREQQQRSFGFRQPPTARPTAILNIFTNNVESQPQPQPLDQNQDFEQPSVPAPAPSELFPSPDFSPFVEPMPLAYLNRQF